LVDLHRFCDFWDIDFPSDLLPKKEEILSWFRGGG